jgi:hypothetical protein
MFMVEDMASNRTTWIFGLLVAALCLCAFWFSMTHLRASGGGSAAGAACEESSACAPELTCQRGTCVTREVIEADLLEQAGVNEPTVLETAPAAGPRVRIRTARGETVIFAACATTERLVGGGCSGGGNCVGQGCSYMRSYPQAANPDDTVGARWYCSGFRDVATAHALCQAIP